MNDINILWKLIKNGREGKNKGISTGLHKLDKIIGGIQPSRYYLISAASSAGKTALVLYIMYNMLKNMTKPTYFIYFSLEIGSEILLSKLMALYCAEEFGIYLTTNDILSFDTILGDYEFECLGKAKSWLESIKDYLIILDNGLSSRILYRETMPVIERLGKIEEIDGRQIYIPNDPEQILVGVIDHMSLIRTEEGRTLKQEIDLMSSYMVTLKRKYRISWFPLMQQNRESSSMDRRKADLSEPGINDTKDSGSPVQDCDVLLQIFYPAREKLTSYRDYRILGEQGMHDAFRSIIISKNRYGIANKVIGCGFYGEVGWWSILPPGREIADFRQYTDIAKNIPNKNYKLLRDTEEKEAKQINYNF